MTRFYRYIPFYLQMIDLLRKAFALLDEQGREEVIQFIVSQQNLDGGFKDRGGKSDLYYSLFGMMLLKAAETGDGRQKAKYLEFGTWNLESGKNLKQFVSNQSSIIIPGFIEQCCLTLLQKELKTKRLSRFKSLLVLGRLFWKERNSINLSYRSFVLFLTLDAVLPFRGILKFGAKGMLTQTLNDQHSPCSEVAAKVFLQKMMGQDKPDEQEMLMSFVSENGGFRAFRHLEQPDMLSTAVALFALDFAGSDLRLLKPACLDFIQSNYSGGAFLSGDGDQTTDVEYTFYGLLALGVLVN